MISRFNRTTTWSIALLTAAALAGCATAPKTSSDREQLVDEARVALNTMLEVDPSLDRFLDSSTGYVIFPSVGKGGLIIGGSYGRGVVYANGQMIGYADITQATVGLQAGGQTFRELVVFQDQTALDTFRQGEFRFTANASAVILKSGVAAATPFENGVAVFVQPIGGAMAAATVGGQSFSFEPAR